jgi:hypothetical protein
MYCTNCGENKGESANFCSKCGQSMAVVQSDSDGDEKQHFLPMNEKSKFFEIASSVKISIDLDGNVHSIADFEMLCMLMKKSIKSTALHKTIYNIYASTEFLIIFPVSNDKSNIAMWGLLLGGGALGGAAVELLTHVAKKMEKKDCDIDFEKTNLFFNSIVYRTKDISIKFKECTNKSGIFFGATTVDTYFKILGPAQFNGKEYRLEVNFNVPGQCSESSKNKPLPFNMLTSTLGISNPVITKGKGYFPAEWSVAKNHASRLDK